MKDDDNTLTTPFPSVFSFFFLFSASCEAARARERGRRGVRQHVLDHGHLLPSAADAATHARVAADAAVAGANADRVADGARVAALEAVAVGHVGGDWVFLLLLWGDEMSF
jgi:hypothetical protein